MGTRCHVLLSEESVYNVTEMPETHCPLLTFTRRTDSGQCSSVTIYHTNLPLWKYYLHNTYST